MTRDDALKYIPPGFVECSVYTYNASDDSMRFNFINDGIRGCIYAIPAPKPEPRRVPCGPMKTILLCALFGVLAAYALDGIISNALQLQTHQEELLADIVFPQPPHQEPPTKKPDPAPLTEARVRAIVKDELNQRFRAVRYPVLPDARPKRGGR